MGRINVPAGGGKREKTLLNGKSFGEFGNKIGYFAPDMRLKGKSENDDYVAFSLISGNTAYTAIYGIDGVKQTQFATGEPFAVYVDESRAVYCVVNRELTKYNFNGLALSHDTFTSRLISSAHFANGFLYTIEVANAGTVLTKEFFAVKYNLQGNRVLEQFLVGSNRASLDRCTWVMGDNDEKVIIKSFSSPWMCFDFNTKKVKRSRLLNSEGWGLEEQFLIGEKFVIPEVFRSSDFKIQSFSYPIFSRELNEYILLAKAFVDENNPNGFLLVFLIDRDGADDVEVRMLNHSITEGSFTFDPVFLESKRILIFKELARNPQFIAF